MAVRAGSDDPLREPEPAVDPHRAVVESQWRRDHDRRSTRAVAERRMLFATTGLTRSVHALRRAYELASGRQSTLYVLHVPDKSEPAPATRGAERALAQATLRAVRRFCDRGLEDTIPRDHLLVRHGEFATVVAEAARELDASLVIIPGVERRKGNAVARIAHRAGVPVLVARRSGLGSGIVAATDFGDPECYELRQAAALSSQLPGRLAFVHNVKPIVHAVSTGLGHCMCTVIEPSARALAECRQRLQALAEFFGVYADTRVVSRPNAEDAILEVARETGADLIVVGARRQSWLERLFGTTLAARIVDRCERSVLVAPLCVDRALPPGTVLN